LTFFICVCYVSEWWLLCATLLLLLMLLLEGFEGEGKDGWEERIGRGRNYTTNCRFCLVDVDV